MFYLQVSNLSLSRGGEDILKSGLSFDLISGESLSVHGSNGSGKTTLLKTLLGLSRACLGTIAFSHQKNPSAFLDLRLYAHYVSHHNALKPALTVEENLSFWHAVMQEKEKTVLKAYDEDYFGLRSLWEMPVGLLSCGQKRRVALARLKIITRPVWVLDEPTSGLDDEHTEHLTKAFADHLSEGGLVIAATHSHLGLNGKRLSL